MTRTKEQMDAAAALEAVMSWYVIRPDAEGWPISKGRYGRMEHLGAGQLAAFTDRRGIRARLYAVPGGKVTQRGDTELRVLVEPDAVVTVARLLRCRRSPGTPPPERLAAMLNARHSGTKTGQQGGSEHTGEVLVQGTPS